MAFYRAALGATEVYRLEGDGGGLAVAQLAVGGADFWLQEDPAAGPGTPGAAGCLILTVADPDAVLARALAAGWPRSSRSARPTGGAWGASSTPSATTGRSGAGSASPASKYGGGRHGLRRMPPGPPGERAIVRLLRTYRQPDRPGAGGRLRAEGAQEVAAGSGAASVAPRTVRSDGDVSPGGHPQSWARGGLAPGAAASDRGPPRFLTFDFRAGSRRAR